VRHFLNLQSSVLRKIVEDLILRHLASVLCRESINRLFDAGPFDFLCLRSSACDCLGLRCRGCVRHLGFDHARESAVKVGVLVRNTACFSDFARHKTDVSRRRVEPFGQGDYPALVVSGDGVCGFDLCELIAAKNDERIAAISLNFVLVNDGVEREVFELGSNDCGDIALKLVFSFDLPIGQCVLGFILWEWNFRFRLFTQFIPMVRDGF